MRVSYGTISEVAPIGNGFPGYPTACVEYRTEPGKLVATAVIRTVGSAPTLLVPCSATA